MDLNDKERRLRQLYHYCWFKIRKIDKEKLEKKIKDHDEEKLKNTRILQASVDEKSE